MILTWEYLGYGRKPQLMRGSQFVMRRSGTDTAGATLVGRWANVLHIRSSNGRLEIKSSNSRLDIKSENERLEL
jgi:hypothetical protein